MRGFIGVCATTIGSVAFQMSVQFGYIQNLKWATPWVWALSLGLWVAWAASYPAVKERWFKDFHGRVGSWIYVIRFAICLFVSLGVGFGLRAIMKERKEKVTPANTTRSLPLSAPQTSQTTSGNTQNDGSVNSKSKPNKPKLEKAKPVLRPDKNSSVAVQGDVEQKSTGDCSPNVLGNGNTVNPTCSTTAQPPPKLSTREELLPRTSDGAYMTKVYIRSDQAIPQAAFAIIFTDRVSVAQSPNEPGVLNSIMESIQTIPGPLKHEGVEIPNSVGFAISIPEVFAPNMDFIFTVNSKTPVHVVAVHLAQMGRN